MHTLRATTLQGLILSCRNVTRFFVDRVLINNFMVKNSFSETKNQRKSNISRPIYFEKMSTHRFVGLISTNKLDEFFFENNFFPRTWSFFHDCGTTNLDVIPQKNNSVVFFKGDYLILI